VVVVGLLSLLLHWVSSKPAKPLVIVYGDSLTVQSAPDARRLHSAAGERVVFRARGGTAMCDWVAQAGRDQLAMNPQRVVLAFTGNTASCAAAAFLSGGTDAATALYEHSLRQMRAIFRGVPITLVIPPAMNDQTTGWYPFNGSPELVAMYKRVGPQLHMTINTRADDWLTPGHIFVQDRPEYPKGPLVAVRLSDGIHLTPAGELWYGAALLAV
jgi:hypothetical protein